MQTDFQAAASLLFSSSQKSQCKSYFLDFARRDISDYLQRCVNLLLSGKTVEAQTGYVLLNMVVKKGMLAKGSQKVVQECYGRVYGWMSKCSEDKVQVPRIVCGSLACFASRGGEVAERVKEMWEMAVKYRSYRYVAIGNEESTNTGVTVNQVCNPWLASLTQLLDYLGTENTLTKQTRQLIFKYLKSALSDSSPIPNLHKNQRRQHLSLVCQFIHLFIPVHESQLDFLLQVLSSFSSDPQQLCQTALLSCYQQLFSSYNHLVFKHISLVFHNTKSLMSRNPAFLELWTDILSPDNFKNYSACVRDQLKTICQELLGILLGNIRQMDISVGSYLLATLSADIVVQISRVVSGLVFYNTVKRGVMSRERVRPSGVIMAALVVMFGTGNSEQDARVYLTMLNTSLKDIFNQPDPQLLISTLLSVNYLLSCNHRKIILSHAQTTILIYKLLIKILISQSYSKQITEQASTAIDQLVSSDLPKSLTDSAFEKIIQLCQLSLFKPEKKKDVSVKEKVLTLVGKFAEELTMEQVEKILTDSVGFLDDVKIFTSDEVCVLAQFFATLLKLCPNHPEMLPWTVSSLQSTSSAHLLPLLSLCLQPCPLLLQQYLPTLTSLLSTLPQTQSVMLIYLQLLQKGILELDIKKVFTAMIGELKKEDVEYETKVKYLNVLIKRIEGLRDRMKGYAGRVHSGMIRALAGEMRVKLPKDRDKSDKFKCLVIQCLSLLAILFRQDFDGKAINDMVRHIQDILTETERCLFNRNSKELKLTEQVLLLQVLTYGLIVCAYLPAQGQDQLSLIRQIHKMVRASQSLPHKRRLPQFFIFYAETITHT